MRRRALLSSAALAFATTGCLADVRRATTGEIRHDHSRLTVRDARDAFVRGGLTADSDERFRAWVFLEAPSDEETVFTDALGSERQREWNEEIHDEDYERGFALLVQSVMARENAHEMSPMALPDPTWTGWRRARIPLVFAPTDLGADEYADAERVTCTFLGYYTADAAPDRVTVALHQEGDGQIQREPGDVFATFEAGRWPSA